MKISHLICLANQMTGFHMEYNIGLKLVNVQTVTLDVFKINNKDTINVVLVFLLSTLNRFNTKTQHIHQVILFVTLNWCLTAGLM